MDDAETTLSADVLTVKEWH